MALTVGSRLGHYDVTALIGEGGMGQVYRATDTQLGRDVALKTLPDAFAADLDRLARFQREAQVLASLNHPNIAQIHGIAEGEPAPQQGVAQGFSPAVKALVLELVEGPTLADRIAKGPVPLDEALPIAKQIAEALEAAHEAGVIHRDLKPANIKVREDGTVKVLDFGLAKALDTTPEGDPSQSPTLTAAATQMGVIMGTAAYMAPEQARGKPVDKRADIWAFGVVLYEMLTATPPFAGDDVSATLAKVIERDADLELLPSPLPTPLLRMLRRSLAKDPRVRLRDIGDALAEIEEAIRGGDETSLPTAVVPEAPRVVRPYFIAAVVVVTAFVAAAVTWLAIPTADIPLRKSERVIEGLQSSFRSRPSLSPHGERLLYRTNDGLWIWSLDELAPREIRDEDGRGFPGARGAAFWSPDGTSVAFAHEGRLLRASVDGGAVTLICNVDELLIGGAWSDDDTIVFAAWRGDLFEVPAAGGTPRPYLARDPETEVDFHRLAFLPDGRGLLYSVHQREGGHVGVYAEGRRRVLIDGAGAGSYSPSGHVVYNADGRIWAVPFSLSSLETTGAPFVIAAGDASRVSSDGTLSYISSSDMPPIGQLVRVDGDGRVIGLVSQPRELMSAPAVAPDGNRVAVYAVEDDEAGIWVYDVGRDTSSRIFAWEGSWRDSLAWHPSGTEVVFTMSRDGEFFNDIVAVPADGSGDPRILVSGDGRSMPTSPSFASDGRYLAYAQSEQDASTALWSLQLDADGAPMSQPEQLQVRDIPRGRIAVSPGGRHAAYTVDEAGQLSVYLTAFPSGEGRLKVSLDEGHTPRWGADGGKIFYTAGRQLMMVPVATDPEVRIGTAEVLFDLPEEFPGSYAVYDVAAGGQELIGVRQVGGEVASSIVVVQNWYAEFADQD